MTRSVEIPEACNCAHGQDGYSHSVGCPAYVHVGVRPVESAAIPDAAVKAAWDVFWGPDSTMVMDGRGARQMRRLLVAARPYLMPTREEIEEVISDELDGEGFLPQFVAPKLARRVFDLLTSEPIRRDYTECPDEDCRSGGPHPISQDGTEMECRSCHVGFPNPFHATSGESGE